MVIEDECSYFWVGVICGSYDGPKGKDRWFLRDPSVLGVAEVLERGQIERKKGRNERDLRGMWA